MTIYTDRFIVVVVVMHVFDAISDRVGGEVIRTTI